MSANPVLCDSPKEPESRAASHCSAAAVQAFPADRGRGETSVELLNNPLPLRRHLVGAFSKQDAGAVLSRRTRSSQRLWLSMY